jgi:hypothetical protein
MQHTMISKQQYGAMVAISMHASTSQRLFINKNDTKKQQPLGGLSLLSIQTIPLPEHASANVK